MPKVPTTSVFSGALTKQDMKAFQDEADRLGITRVSLLRMWIKRAAARHKL